MQDRYPPRRLLRWPRNPLAALNLYLATTRDLVFAPGGRQPMLLCSVFQKGGTNCVSRRIVKWTTLANL